MFAYYSGFFLEYGTTAGDQASFASDDTCTALPNLGYRVPFRGTGYRKIYVSVSLLFSYTITFHMQIQLVRIRDKASLSRKTYPNYAFECYNLYFTNM
ncbi:hypothetical protein DPMN_076336 [Dreissena polymorpha]|uniref:Uncharacterized protein n=1 Tax=Dreissena polymorpha TaxID=45954 RepID=A0A9D3YMV5_DREPO|nr:hypothetical protein DPMN_076336 [Dreissena polymorpha]